MGKGQKTRQGIQWAVVVLETLAQQTDVHRARKEEEKVGKASGPNQRDGAAL